VLINMTGATAASSPFDPQPEPQEDPAPEPPTVADTVTLPLRNEIALLDKADTVEMEIEMEKNPVAAPVHISVPNLAFLPIAVPDTDFIPISVPTSVHVWPISVRVDVSATVPIQVSVPAADASLALSETRGRPPSTVAAAKNDGRKRKSVEMQESEDPGYSSSRRSPLTILPIRTSSRFAPPKEKEKEKENEKEARVKEKVKEQEKEEEEEKEEKDKEQEQEASEPQPQAPEEEEAKTESPATSPSSSSSSKKKRAKRSEDVPLKGSKVTDGARGNVQNGRPVRSAKLFAAAALVASKGEW
jgi:hypothetical protein